MTPTGNGESRDFSLVSGGPLFQLYLRTQLSGSSLELLPRRVFAVTSFAWLPLLLLSLHNRNILGGGIKVPFLYDIETQARFLVALPLLIGCEVVVQALIGPAVQRFLERGIIVPADIPAFNAAVDSAIKLRNSIAAELALLGLVYTLGLWFWRTNVASGATTWYASPTLHHLNLTLAGYWYAWVSIPLFQFYSIRWYLRLLIWFRLLWQISRLNLHLTAAHPDRVGGIGLLGKASYAFGPILFAQGALLAGVIANRVLYGGQNLMSFKFEAAGFISVFVLCVLGPLTMFTPKLELTKRLDSAKYGLLANRYVFGFEEKWLQQRLLAKDDLLGSADIQSLADLANSCSVVFAMRIVPFGFEEIITLAIFAASPLLPLLLTIFSLQDLLTRVFAIVFR